MCVNEDVDVTGYIPNIHRYKRFRLDEEMWRRKKPTSSRNSPSKMAARPAGMRKSHSSSLMADKTHGT